MGCGTTSRAGLEPATPGLDDDDVERPEVYRPGVPPMWCSSMSATNLKKKSQKKKAIYKYNLHLFFRFFILTRSKKKPRINHHHKRRKRLEIQSSLILQILHFNPLKKTKKINHHDKRRKRFTNTIFT
jgi:hypothetical protein